MRPTALIAGILLLAAVAHGADRPCIVLVLVDDLGRADLGDAAGPASSATPSLDALAASGLRLDWFFGTPRCHPSRAQLMTGLYPRAGSDSAAASRGGTT